MQVSSVQALVLNMVNSSRQTHSPQKVALWFVGASAFKNSEEAFRCYATLLKPWSYEASYSRERPVRVIARKSGHTGRVTRASFKLQVTLAWVGRLYLRLRSFRFS